MVTRRWWPWGQKSVTAQFRYPNFETTLPPVCSYPAANHSKPQTTIWINFVVLPPMIFSSAGPVPRIGAGLRSFTLRPSKYARRTAALRPATSSACASSSRSFLLLWPGCLLYRWRSSSVRLTCRLSVKVRTTSASNWDFCDAQT